MKHISTDRIVPLIEFLTLSSVVFVLFGFTVFHAWVLHSLGEIVVILVIVGMVFGILREGQSLPRLSVKHILTRHSLKNFIAVFLGAVVSYTLNVNVGLGAVTSASLVALIASLILPGYGVPIYCGSFVGMTSAELLVGYGDLSLAGTVAGILFVLTADVFTGFGGKLGTIAFAGSLITRLGLKREFIVTPVPEWNVIWQVILYSVVATAITYWLSVKRKHGGVMASGIVGITGGLILPAVYPGEVGRTLAVMVICASFAGMSSAKRFPHIVQMILVGWITGMIFVYSMPLAGGAGGKLGTIAFGSAVAVYGHMTLVRKLRRKRVEGSSVRKD